MRIFGISGSSQRRSTNYAVLETAAAHIYGEHRVDIFADLDKIPPFDPIRADHNVPHEVTVLRRDIGHAQGVIIVSPEYAHSLPGPLKNALDWLVGTGEFANKPVAIITASTTPTGGLRAQVALIQTLLAHSAEIVALLSISASRMKINDGRIIHAATKRRIEETVAALVERCSEIDANRIER